jgi:hypothetical protein
MAKPSSDFNLSQKSPTQTPGRTQRWAQDLQCKTLVCTSLNDSQNYTEPSDTKDSGYVESSWIQFRK